jgi:Zn-dependent protease
VDVLGTILILIAGFGWAKPVPVNIGRFKRPRLMGIIVSAVGPLANLVVGVFAIVLIHLLSQTGLLYAGSEGVYKALIHLCYYLFSINLMLFVFNLIPIPPLDGYRIVADLLPLKWRYKLEQNIQWGIILFLLMVFIPQLRAVTIEPILSLSVDIMSGVWTLCEAVFSKPMDWDRFVIDFLA